ncbi:MAG: lytic murein transglycosylase, partial [Methylococcales bacterium]
MNYKTTLIHLSIAGLCLLLSACATELKETDAQQAFIENMATKHQFNAAELSNLFAEVRIKPEIIKRISSPAEALPWYKYRKIFMTDARI